MIDLKHYERILNSGLLLDHYLVLCMVKNNEELPTNKRVQGFLNLLNKKGYIQDGALTDEGVILTEHDVSLNDSPKGEERIDMAKWVMEIHRKCQNRLLELVGAKQVRDKIHNKSYPFLPNTTDMLKSLHRAMVIYKLTDLDKIERAIMGHIDKCHKARSWFPLMKYYIIKSGSGGSIASATSDMATDIDSIDDKEETGSGKSTQKFV